MSTRTVLLIIVAIAFPLLCCGVPTGCLIVRHWQTKQAANTTVAPASNATATGNVGYRRTMLTYISPGGQTRSRQLDLWYPTSQPDQRHDYAGQIGQCAVDAPVASGRHPLLVFSHGFMGASDQTIFLMEACARAGYIVASANHADASTGPRGRKVEMPKFLDAKNWTDANHRDRQEDISALINKLLEWDRTPTSPWHERIDVNTIGGIGHSLGGYTLLGMAGGWPTWVDRRIKAMVLLSPFAQPFDSTGNLRNVQVPILMQGGTLDFGITPFLPSIYRQLGGPKTYLELKNETHFGWTNLISLGKTTTEAAANGNGELMVRYSIAHFDHHLRGLDRRPTLTTGDPKLHRFQSHLNQN